jgi:hypothetical protein
MSCLDVESAAVQSLGAKSGLASLGYPLESSRIMSYRNWLTISDFPRTAVECGNRFFCVGSCGDYLMRTRWPDGFMCPNCGNGEA